VTFYISALKILLLTYLLTYLLTQRGTDRDKLCDELQPTNCKHDRFTHLARVHERYQQFNDPTV